MNYEKLLDIIILNIIPRTIINVAKGNKIFGAAILNRDDLSIATIGLNNEIYNPLLHGEISTINNFFNLNKRNDSKDYIFLTTHEPCSLCLSAITWSGFDNFYYFFPYSDTKNKFSIPHDLKIMYEIFNIKQGNYNSSNFYWQSFSIINEIFNLPIDLKKRLKLKINKIFKEYEYLSIKYQENKDLNKIPLK